VAVAPKSTAARPVGSSTAPFATVINVQRVVRGQQSRRRLAEAPSPDVPLGVVVSEPGLVRTPEAAEIVAWQSPETAALDALRSFFDSLAAPSNVITRAHFKAFCVGPQIPNPDAVFECLDVDRSGAISFDELLYAVAGRYLGAQDTDPRDAWHAAIAGLSRSLAALEDRGRKMDAAAFRAARESSKGWHPSSQKYFGHSTGVKCGQYVAALLCPCYICCTTRGHALNAQKKLVGMQAVMEYIVACRDAPVRYRWSIQNYHMERRTYRDENGHRYTETSRVDTHKAKTGGMLISTDETPTFQPNVTKASVALKSFVEAAPDEDFKQEYDRRRQMFYLSNTSDTYQECKEWFELGPMKAHAHVVWVDTPTPWYASGCAQCLAAVTCTAVCWLGAMDNYMGKQTVTFKKKFSRFVATPQTPQNLRNFAHLWPPRRVIDRP
jgi:hypothetical protein